MNYAVKINKLKKIIEFYNKTNKILLNEFVQKNKIDIPDYSITFSENNSNIITYIGGIQLYLNNKYTKFYSEELFLKKKDAENDVAGKVLRYLNYIFFIKNHFNEFKNNFFFSKLTIQIDNFIDERNKVTNYLNKINSKINDKMKEISDLCIRFRNKHNWICVREKGLYGEKNIYCSFVNNINIQIIISLLNFLNQIYFSFVK